MDKYTPEDFEVWKILFERQVENLKTKGSQVYLNALIEMRDVLNPQTIPDFKLVNEWFKQKTDWEIVVVPGLIPVTEFFELLANKRFCSSTWLRSKENLDYLEEPDMFHDTFGHIPLLSNPVFSAFMEAFGKLGVRFKNNPEIEVQLQRLYWYTIEFGVIREESGIKSYGAGIMSSFGETNLIAQGVGNYFNFEIEEAINLPFRNDAIQENYFILNDFEDLFESIQELEKTLLRSLT